MPGFYLTRPSARQLQQHPPGRCASRPSGFLNGGEARCRERAPGGHRVIWQERKTRTGNKMGIIDIFSSSLPASHEAVLFSENAETSIATLYRAWKMPSLSPRSAKSGPKVSACVCRPFSRWRKSPCRCRRLCAVYVRDSGPLRAVAAHLNAKGDGLVSFIVIK